MRSVRELVKQFWGFELASYQVKIIESIIFKAHPRVIISAATQVGKSFAVGIGITLLAWLHGNEKIVIVAPTYKQAKIVMDYVLKFISECKTIADELSMVVSQKDYERLKSEVSKARLTFKNGSSISILSADNPNSLLGHSATTLILDESSLIDDDTYRTKILRMLIAETGKTNMLIEIGNPFKLNHFYETWNSDYYEKIKITWRDAVNENRLNEETVQNMRKVLTEDEFRIWYEAEFPEKYVKGIFTFQEYEKGLKDVSPPNSKEEFVCIGVDVARYGTDKSVISLGRVIGDSLEIFEFRAFLKNDITELAEEVMKIMNEYPNHNVVVDVIGIGAGVYDYIARNSMRVIEFNSQSKPRNEKRFSNMKSEMVMMVKSAIGEKLFYVHNEQLKADMLNMEYVQDSKGRLKVKDPEKSPDFLDSMLMCYTAFLNKPYHGVAFEDRTDIYEEAGIFI